MNAPRETPQATPTERPAAAIFRARRGLMRWAVLLGTAVAATLLLSRNLDLRDTIDRAIGWVREAGPGPFFTAMALVPAPLWMFTVPAGEAFAAQLTLPGVIAAALGAIAIQIAVCYGLARYALRPVLEKWARRLGYTVPRLTPENAFSVALLVRLTPGPPLFLQCFLLGMAEMPFRLYMIVSWLCTVPWVIGGVVLGRGVLNGSFPILMVGIGLLAATGVAVRLVRRRLRMRAGGP